MIRPFSCSLILFTQNNAIIDNVHICMRDKSDKLLSLGYYFYKKWYQNKLAVESGPDYYEHLYCRDKSVCVAHIRPPSSLFYLQ